MNGRSIAVVVGLVAAPLGLFRRREKDEWLGELAEIRNEALGVHGPGLDHADVPAPLSPAGIDGDHPGAGDLPAGVPDPPAAPGPEPDDADQPDAPAPAPAVPADDDDAVARDADAHGADPHGGDAHDGDPHDADPHDGDEDATTGLRAPGWANREVVATVPGGPTGPADTGHGVLPDRSAVTEPAEAVHPDATVDAGTAPSPDPVEAPPGFAVSPEPDHVGAAPPDPDPDRRAVLDAAAAGPGVDAAPDPAGAPPQPAGPEVVTPVLDAPPADRRPAPHRQRPGELWHPALDLTLAVPTEIQPEERIDPSELVDPDPDPAFATRARPFIGGPEAANGDPHAAAPGLDLGMAGPGGIAPDVLDDADPPPPEVLTARDLDEGPASVPDLDAVVPTVPGGGAPRRADGSGDGPAALLGPDRPRIRPPSEVFDGPPPVGGTPSPAPSGVPGDAPAGELPALPAAGERSLVGEPVSRRLHPGASRRSLFGPPLAQHPGGPDPSTGPPTDDPPLTAPADTAPSTVEPPTVEPSTVGPEPAGDGGGGPGPVADGSDPAPSAVEGLEILTLREDGTVALPAGVVRLAPGSGPEVSRLGGTVGLTLGSGWCWVASTATADPVLLTLPTASLLVPPGGHALTVVEGDGSVFVSVVRGTSTLDRPGGTVALPVGTIAHLRRDGTVHTDQATPEEMATDEILTRNLTLDAQSPH